MKFIFLDFETFYSKDYSLRKMTPAEYILDPRFETICVTAKVDDGPTIFIDGPDFTTWLSQFDPKDCTVLTYNALFDMCILYWHYGFLPARMIDVLGMARTLLGWKLPRLSLAHVSEHLKVGTKYDTILHVMDLHRADIIASGWTDGIGRSLWEAFKLYAINDTNLLYGVFNKLAPEFPRSEYRVMDLILRCAVAPRFVADVPMLEAHLADVRLTKEHLLAQAGVGTDTLQSAGYFKEALEACGVKVEMKAGKNSMIPAFAKTDDFMHKLLNHDDPQVQALAAARLGVKSTLEETRCERLITIAKLPWQSYRDGNPRFYTGGTMPIPLRYGPHTLRFSGDWKINMQNLPRGSKLRKALKAPPGFKVVVADLGQIEARLTAWFCGSKNMMRVFHSGGDPYCALATAIFGFVVTKANEFERFIGKGGVLGLGFGAGPDKFFNMVVRAARAARMDMDKVRAMWTPELAEKTVTVYRTDNSEIRTMWYHLDRILADAWSGGYGPHKRGPVVIDKGRVIGPGHLEMRYEVLPYASGEDRMYAYGGIPHKIYGAKFLENIIQFLARIILMNAALRLADRGYPFALQAHDELAFIVLDSDVENAKIIIQEEMTRRPSWASDLPLTASVGVGQSYGDAK